MLLSPNEQDHKMLLCKGGLACYEECCLQQSSGGAKGGGGLGGHKLEQNALKCPPYMGT